MRRLLFMLLGLCLVSSLAYAADDATATAGRATSAAAQSVELKGKIIDNASVEANRDNLAEFIKTYTKKDALKGIGKGYSIFVDGKSYFFDSESNGKVDWFLNQPGSNLDITVTAKRIGDELSDAVIENQK